MTLFGKNFDQIAEADLAGLVAIGAPESLVLEYKQAAYTWDHDGRREFLKDVSAFANSSGGHLIIGIKAADGGAAEVLSVPNAAKEIERPKSCRFPTPLKKLIGWKTLPAMDCSRESS